jgi:hypothetical protein
MTYMSIYGVIVNILLMRPWDKLLENMLDTYCVVGTRAHDGNIFLHDEDI